MSIKLHKASYEPPGQSYLERARNILRSQFIDAICQDPKRVIDTPGWNTKSWSAVEELNELYSDIGMEERWLQLTIILGRVANGQMDQLTHLMGKALLAELADKHAKWHGDDMAERLQEEDDAK